MIRLIEALNYRCLRHVRQPLRPFHVLVGPNASGKSTFLDVLAFLGRLVSDGLEAAVEERTRDFYDLTWGRSGQRIEVAVEATIPEQHRSQGDSLSYDTIRYEVAIGLVEESDQLRILKQQIWLARAEDSQESRPPTGLQEPPSSVFWSGEPSGAARLHRHTGHGACWLVPEGWAHERMPSTDNHYWLAVGAANPKQTMFRAVSPQEDFPASTWLSDLLRERVFQIELNNASLRYPSPAGRGKLLQPDGANLPWVVSALQENAPEQFQEWVAHVQTALPDLEGIRSVDRPEEHTRYLMLRYRGGLEVPSWTVSDGTLHLLALTVLAYVPGPAPIYLIEEPENSVHPLNIETILQSLRSVYDGQVLVATHSPVVLGIAEPEEVLVFSRDEENGTRITVGSDHPGLRDWRGEVSLGTLFAGGVLG